MDSGRIRARLFSAGRNTIFAYKCTNYYNKEAKVVLMEDENLSIDWKIKSPLLSEKDKLGDRFINFKSPF